MGLEHPQEAQELIANYSGLPPDLIQAAYPIVQYPYPPYVDVYSCKVMLQGQIDAGKIKSEDVPDIDEFIIEAINNSFVEKTENENISLISLGSSFNIYRSRFRLEYVNLNQDFSMK